LHAIQSGLFESVQIAINIADQKPIEEVLPLAAKLHIGVIVKRPLANLLWKSPIRPDADHHQAYWDRLQHLKYAFLRETRGIDVALRFLFSLPGIDTVLVGTTSVLHLQQDAALI
jgi:aryl-alcohol dehydrogenase-like predicted oxidoreductase